MTKERANIIYLPVFLAAALGLVLLYFFIYPLYEQYFPKCIFHLVTGLHCPGCGTQRALVALLHGDILSALHDNFLAVILSPFLFYVLAVFFYNLFSSQKKYTSVFNTFLSARFILFLVLAFAVLRNIPLYPFTLLAPL